MLKFRNFTVIPSVPEKIKDLRTIAYNMLWSWHGECVDIFTRIDSDLWRQSGHNPVAMLGMVSQSRLDELAENEGFIYQLGQAKEKMDEYLEAPSWYDKVYRNKGDGEHCIAYFSAEFGIHESLPIYSGGLGLLAGDHLKSASDLGLPLVGVGLIYYKGYFRQYLNTDGWQQEHLEDSDFHNMPLELVRDEGQRPLLVSVEYPGRDVKAQIWKLQVGRVRLFLLDTNIMENNVEDRSITAQLYGGDRETRIRQEIMLGIGGLRALVMMGINPAVCHMNEGHAAFLALERVRRLMSENSLSFEEATELAKASNVFTVHTPVAAGNDEFSAELMDKYFEGYYKQLGIDREKFFALARVGGEDVVEIEKDEKGREVRTEEKFKMPVLALKMSTYRNGVSELHGYVSRKIWRDIWKGLPFDEVPIRYITNGVHPRTWVSGELNSLFERYLGSNWPQEAVDKSMWQSVDQIPDGEFWRIHQRCRERLIGFSRQRLKMQLQRRGSFHTELRKAEEVLDPEALTIGFARRFATYKRGDLVLRDAERLIRLLRDEKRPVQFVFAGKAHPKDSGGKELIKRIVHFSSQDNVRRKMVFLEDYDINVARFMVQGVDVWLNNPRRPLEASGTSGMKAALNGILNLSTLDGWWCEGYTPQGGWAIGSGEEYDDLDYQDAVESEAIYNLMENEIVPLFYTRSADGLPRAWIKRMKNTIKWCGPRFNTNRMVSEYTRRFYSPAASKWHKLNQEGKAKVKEISRWKEKVKEHWNEVEIEHVEMQVERSGEVVSLDVSEPQLEVGAGLKVQAWVKLGKLKPEDVSVEVYFGKVDSSGHIEKGNVATMNHIEGEEQDGAMKFLGEVPCNISGEHGFAVRVVPHHTDMSDPYEPGMIIWEDMQ
jgi:starch phosphorylase